MLRLKFGFWNGFFFIIWVLVVEFCFLGLVVSNFIFSILLNLMVVKFFIIIFLRDLIIYKIMYIFKLIVDYFIL